MKTRLLWLAIFAVGLTAAWFGITRPETTAIPASVRDALADIKPPPLPPIELPELVLPSPPELELPTIQAPTADAQPAAQSQPPAARVTPDYHPPEVPIQNEATIDFSTGSPVVRTFGEDQAAVEKTTREMAEAAKDTSFEAKK